MLALGWIFGATLLLSIQDNSLALPTASIQSANSEHLTNAVLIEGQDAPPCVNEICPQLSATFPEGLPNSTSNAPIQESKTEHITKRADVTPGQQTEDASDLVPNCTASLEDKLKAETARLHSAKLERLRAAYRIKGQPPPPCHSHICPLTQQRRTVLIENDPDVRNPSLRRSKHKHFRADFIFSDDDQTVPPELSNIHDIPLHDLKKTHHSPLVNTACRANRTKPLVPVHQTAPITCGDGTKPPCAKQIQEGTQPSSNESIYHLPPTKQTAPVHCGDGTKPPCAMD